MNGDKQMIQKAAVFAAKAHEGMMRKGSKIPYIYHPMEVALIVAQMTDDPEVIAAAYLHDVIEDAGVRYVKGKNRTNKESSYGNLFCRGCFFECVVQVYVTVRKTISQDT